MVKRYAEQNAHVRPLCLAIFGPPGSGKSFAMEQIVEGVKAEIREPFDERIKDLRARPGGVDPKAEVAKIEAEAKQALDDAPPLEAEPVYNLTQVPDEAALARSLRDVAAKVQLGAGDRRNVPIVFFDEFDAPLGGAPYGWLPWFLAPMHDGKFFCEKEITLQRAVYVFVGGTASTMEEFAARRRRADFREAKGPDFVSRLRGFFDVPGPNTTPRTLRRAFVLRKELKKRREALGAAIRIEPDLLDALLHAGRYVHGARSIGAVFEMSNVTKDQPSFGFQQLPKAHVLAQHADRGPLDLQVIGGTIALSGYTEDEAVGENIKVAWLTIARKLWAEGATLAYGGAPGKKLTEALHDELKLKKCELRRSDENTAVWLWRFQTADRIGAKAPEGVAWAPPPDLTDTEKAFVKERPADADHRWVGEALQRFRKRLHVSEMSVARFAIAGKDVDYNGRFSGIAEEVMLTLALGKPVYIAGCYGGAAADVGALLGLARPWKGEKLTAFEPVLNERRLSLLERFSSTMRPPSLNELPLTQDALVQFFKDRAIDSPRWPDNGLTTIENRRLFECDKVEEIADLVMMGLSRRFGEQGAGDGPAPGARRSR